MRRHKHPPEVAVSANVAVDVLDSLAVRGRHAFTYVDWLGVIERLTVAAMAREAAQWASGIRKRGVQPGDRVIVLAERDRRWPCALLGVLEAGGVAVPCPASTPADEIGAIAVDAGARLLVSARAPTDLAGLELPVLSGDDLDPRGRPDGVAAHKSRPDDVALILYAGDAAVLRGSPHSHASLLAQAEADEHWLGVDAGERFWCTVDEGLAASVSLLLAVWRKGAEIVIVDCELDAREQLDLLDRFHPAVVWFADAEYGLLASAAPPAWAEAISIRRALTSDDPGEGAAAFERVFGAEITQARASDGIGIAPAQHPGAAVSERSQEPEPEVRQTKKDTGPTVDTRAAARSGKATTPTAAEPAANEPSASAAPEPTGAVLKPELVLETIGGSEAAGITRRPAYSRGPGAVAGHVRHVVVGVAQAARGLTHQLTHAAVALARPLPRAAAALIRFAVHAVRLFARFVLRAARELAPALPRATAVLRRSLRLAVHAGRLFAHFVLRAARELAPALPRATAALRRSLRLAVHAGRLFAHFVLRAARDLALLLPRARAALKRSTRPVRRGDDQPETRQAAALVMAWVPPRAEPSDEPSKVGLDDHHADDDTRKSDVGTTESPSPEYRSDRIRYRPRVERAGEDRLEVDVIARVQGYIPEKDGVGNDGALVISHEPEIATPQGDLTVTDNHPIEADAHEVEEVEAYIKELALVVATRQGDPKPGAPTVYFTISHGYSGGRARFYCGHVIQEDFERWHAYRDPRNEKGDCCPVCVVDHIADGDVIRDDWSACESLSYLLAGPQGAAEFKRAKEPARSDLVDPAP
jgi:hypothetical protein